MHRCNSICFCLSCLAKIEQPRVSKDQCVHRCQFLTVFISKALCSQKNQEIQEWKELIDLETIKEKMFQATLCKNNVYVIMKSFKLYWWHLFLFVKK